MRKLIILLAIFLFPLYSMGQYVTLTDTAFRNWIGVNYPGAIVGGQLDTMHLSITGTTVLFISGYGLSFSDLDGLKYFDSVTNLYCGALNLSGLAELPPNLIRLELGPNNIFSLPALPNTLEYLAVYSCALSTVPTLPNSLKYLNLDGNPITVLPTLPPGLRNLSCFSCQLTNLPALPNSLDTLYVANNQLTSLPALPDTMILLEATNNQLTSIPAFPLDAHVIRCGHNQLSAIPILPDSLFSLSCDYNSISQLPTLPNSLKTLVCDNNQLTSVPAIPPTLQILECQNNQLTVLPALPNTLFRLDCSNNLLTTLPSLPMDLQYVYVNNNNLNQLPQLPNLIRYLHCHNNQLTAIPDMPGIIFQRLICTDNQLTCLPILPNTIRRLTYLAGNSITCLPNYPLDIELANSDPLVQLCTTISGCSIFPNVGGKTYLDSTNNSIYNPGEPLIDILPVFINPGNIQSGVYNGIWGYPVDTAKTYTIGSSFNNTYYTVVPDTYMVSLPDFFTVDTNLNFGLQPLGSFQDLNVDALSLNNPRPGFQYKLRVNYSNPGTVIQNGVLEVFYNDSILTFDMANTTPTSQTNGIINFNLGTLSLLEKGFIDVWFNVDSATNLGAILQTAAIISPIANDQTPLNNADTLIETVMGSFDPNDKLVSDTTLFPFQVMNSEWLEYTIRFQNTGTASAINVRLEDSLSSYVDWSTFEYMSSSHPNQWFLQNGELIVRYDNIMLPDSGTNQQASNGYFKYRIRVNDNLQVGDEVENFADIFFDFNTPVRTNTTITEVVIITGISENNFIELNIYPNPVNDVLHVDWIGGNVNELLVLDFAGRVLLKENIQITEITFQLDAKKLSTGIYLIKINSKEGESVAKFVKL